MKRLETSDHSRDSAGLTYVYPVISRRAGGVLVGINLNPNNACNWRCIYCQVPSLKKGSAPRIDIALLEDELAWMLGEILHGSFMSDRVPEGFRVLQDIAISGNGEPTSAREFPQVLLAIGRVMKKFDLALKIVLITNGSLVKKPWVREGLGLLRDLGGEVWFKVDRATAEGRRAVNDSAASSRQARENLEIAANLCPTRVQTCLFSLDGLPPSEEECRAYLDFLQGIPLAGVLLYGPAREVLQPEAARIGPLPAGWVEKFAAKLRALGLEVGLSF